LYNGLVHQLWLACTNFKIYGPSIFLHKCHKVFAIWFDAFKKARDAFPLLQKLIETALAERVACPAHKMSDHEYGS
jgi:hypothetical protein